MASRGSLVSQPRHEWGIQSPKTSSPLGSRATGARQHGQPKAYNGRPGVLAAELLARAGDSVDNEDVLAALYGPAPPVHHSEDVKPLSAAALEGLKQPSASLVTPEGLASGTTATLAPWQFKDPSAFLHSFMPVHSPALPDAPMSIVFVAAEVAPWSKTGGLGDVLGALPKALAALGHKVMVVAPRYLNPSTEARYKDLTDTEVTKGIDLGAGGFHTVKYFHQHAENVDWVFVDHISYHRNGSPYGDAAGGVYSDNLFRFALLSLAAIEATLVLPVGGYRFEGVKGQPYGQNCLFVANDWHAALVPVYLAARFRPHEVHMESRCVLAVHNLAHQGSFPPSSFPTLGLPGGWYGTLEWIVNETAPGTPANRPPTTTINVLKAAMVTCDKILTVSQAYAAEICDDPVQGAGLTSLLQQRSGALCGIINGIDTQEWNPSHDPYIPFKYSRATLKRKLACKTALQKELGLPVDTHRPLLGFIGRLDFQKGPDLVLDGLDQLVGGLDCQVVILGSGAADYEEAVQKAEKDYPYYVRGITKFDVPMAHKMMAGCDMLLMPSRFEPCGLNQLYAMRYGTVPIAHATGGLRDTIVDFNEFAPRGAAERGTGWTFSPATLPAFVDAVSAAVRVYSEEPDEWLRLQERCMSQKLSWAHAARQYQTVFYGVMDGLVKKADWTEALASKSKQAQLAVASAPKLRFSSASGNLSAASSLQTPTSSGSVHVHAPSAPPPTPAPEPVRTAAPSVPTPTVAASHASSTQTVTPRPSTATPAMPTTPSVSAIPASPPGTSQTPFQPTDERQPYPVQPAKKLVQMVRRVPVNKKPVTPTPANPVASRPAQATPASASGLPATGSILPPLANPGSTMKSVGSSPTTTGVPQHTPPPSAPAPAPRPATAPAMASASAVPSTPKVVATPKGPKVLEALKASMEIKAQEQLLKAGVKPGGAGPAAAPQTAPTPSSSGGSESSESNGDNRMMRAVRLRAKVLKQLASLKEAEAKALAAAGATKTP